MLKVLRNEQKQPEVPWVEAPVALPDDFPVAVSGLYIQTDRPITMLHRHDVPEIGYCHSGSGIWVVAGKIITFGPGDVVLVSEHETHLAQSTTGTVSEWTWLYCDPLALFAPGVGRLPPPDIARLQGSGFSNVFATDRFAAINSLTRSIIDELRRRQPYHRETVAGLLYALFGQFCRYAPAEAESGASSLRSPRRPQLARLSAAVRHIMSHHADSLSVDGLAAMCNLSTTHFRREFVRELGKSPKEFICEVRLSMAEAELAVGKRKISQIALRCGFATLSAFNRAFRLSRGVTPREWRARHGDGFNGT